VHWCSLWHSCLYFLYVFIYVTCPPAFSNTCFSLIELGTENSRSLFWMQLREIYFNKCHIDALPANQMLTLFSEEEHFCRVVAFLLQIWKISNSNFDPEKGYLRLFVLFSLSLSPVMCRDTYLNCFAGDLLYIFFPSLFPAVIRRYVTS
jgi:hypothetical protein